MPRTIDNPLLTNTPPQRLYLAAKVALSFIEEVHGADHFAAHLLTDAIAEIEQQEGQPCNPAN